MCLIDTNRKSRMKIIYKYIAIEIGLRILILLPSITSMAFYLIGEKLKQANMGKLHSEETKQKMKNSQSARRKLESQLAL